MGKFGEQNLDTSQKKIEGDIKSEEIEEGVEPNIGEKKELAKEEKEKNRGEFLDKETASFGEMSVEQDKNIGLFNVRASEGLIKEEYAEEQIKHLERTKTFIEQVRRKAKSEINFKIEEFLNRYSPEERQKRLEENKEEIEKLEPDLEDLYKKGTAKQDIEDLEQENRIFGELKEGKF